MTKEIIRSTNELLRAEMLKAYWECCRASLPARITAEQFIRTRRGCEMLLAMTLDPFTRSFVERELLNHKLNTSGAL